MRHKYAFAAKTVWFHKAIYFFSFCYPAFLIKVGLVQEAGINTGHTSQPAHTHTRTHTAWITSDAATVCLILKSTLSLVSSTHPPPVTKSVTPAPIPHLTTTDSMLNNRICCHQSFFLMLNQAVLQRDHKDRPSGWGVVWGVWCVCVGEFPNKRKAYSV